MPRRIQRSVGLNAANEPNDVATVQDLLNLVPVSLGGPTVPLKVDGLCYGKTQSAIHRFQQLGAKFFAPDGRVDPDGRTLSKLHEFEKNGGTQFQITRMEVRPLGEPRTEKTLDTFYEIADPRNRKKAIYWFSPPNHKIANPIIAMQTLAARREELALFQTKEPHSIFGFQCRQALHSELSPLATSAKIGLSMVLSDDLAVATLEHRWITPTTSVGKRNDVRGIVTFQAEVSA